MAAALKGTDKLQLVAIAFTAHVWQSGPALYRSLGQANSEIVDEANVLQDLHTTPSHVPRGSPGDHNHEFAVLVIKNCVLEYTHTECSLRQCNFDMSSVYPGTDA